MVRTGAKAVKPPLTTFLRRRVRRRWLIAVTSLVIAFLLAAADHRGLLLYAGDDVARYHGRWFDVVEVTDGDTLKVRSPDGDEPVTRVRLWGIDTPEMGLDGGDPQPFAADAKSLAQQLTAGQRVRLWLEPHRTRGTYQRVIAFVELPDGGVLNEQLLAAGLADVDRRYSHQHMERYERLWEQARHDKVGLWSRVQ